jgi:arginyl-tRNA synthetase
LVDLLDEAKRRCKDTLLERLEHGKSSYWTEEVIQRTSEAIGYGAVK